MNTDRIETQNTEVEETVQQEIVRKLAEKEAARILRKNKREIERLKKHGQMCLVSCNIPGYVYAINKLRGIYKQPLLTEEAGKVMFETSRARLIELIKANVK